MKNTGILLILFSLSLSINIFTQDLDSSNINSYINQATLFIKNGEYSKSRELFRKVLEIKPDYGEAYVLIGIAYVSSVKICKDKPIPKMIYCLAVDMFEKALEVDTSIVKKATKYIEVYSNYFPSKEELLDLPREGEKFKIG